MTEFSYHLNLVIKHVSDLYNVRQMYIKMKESKEYGVILILSFPYSRRLAIIRIYKDTKRGLTRKKMGRENIHI